MIRIYCHRDENNQPVSIHELHKNLLYPAANYDHEWLTDQFVLSMQKLPHSDKYFEFCDWHKDIPMSRQGYYLMHYGSSRSITRNLGLMVLPPEIRDQINDGTLTLLVVFVLETFDEAASLALWQNDFCLLLIDLGITRPNSVKVLLGAHSKSMHEHHDHRVSWIYYPWFEADFQVAAHTKYSSFDNIPKYNPKLRKNHKFLSLNRRSRTHRLLMTAMLEWLDATKYGYITWSDDHDRLILQAENMNSFSTGIKQNSKFHQFILSSKKLTGTYHNSTPDFDNDTMLSAMPLYEQAEFALINETHHQEIGNLIFLTEKTFRTLFFGMPFVLFGNPGSLDLLHRLGYKTFPNVFDESYDKIYAPMRSIEFIARQVHKACVRSPDEHDPLYDQEVTDIVNFNQRHFWTKMHAAEIWKAISYSQA